MAVSEYKEGTIISQNFLLHFTTGDTTSSLDMMLAVLNMNLPPVYLVHEQIAPFKETRWHGKVLLKPSGTWQKPIPFGDCPTGSND